MRLKRFLQSCWYDLTHPNGVGDWTYTILQWAFLLIALFLIVFLVVVIIHPMVLIYK